MGPLFLRDVDRSPSGMWTSLPQGCGPLSLRDVDLSSSGMWTALPQGCGPLSLRDVDLSSSGMGTALPQGCGPLRRDCGPLFLEGVVLSLSLHYLIPYLCFECMICPPYTPIVRQSLHEYTFISS